MAFLFFDQGSIWKIPPCWHSSGAGAVFALAVACRVATVACMVLMDLGLTDHLPSGARQFRPEKGGEFLQLWLLRPFTRWDAAHFLTVAHEGQYVDVPSLAFFPAFPTLVGIIARVVTICTGAELVPSIVIVAVLISNSAFVIAALGMHALSVQVLRSQSAAWRSVMLFCANPAGVFMSTAYSESLFAAASLWGLYYAVRAQSESVDGWHRGLLFGKASLCLAAASATRSTGVFNAVIVGWPLLQHCFMTLAGTLRSRADKHSAMTFASTFVLVGAAILPPLFFDRYSYAWCCGNGRYLVSEEEPSWCTKEASVSAYAEIQHEYWNVGFFQYWQVKQIPNFLLAAPVVALAGQSFVLHSRHAYRRVMVHTQTDRFRMVSAMLVSRGLWAPIEGTLPLDAIPFIAVWLLITTLGLFVFNVQVLTRVVCAMCPAFYWHTQQLLARELYGCQAALAFFAVYNVLGAAMHSNHYPWT